MKHRLIITLKSGAKIKVRVKDFTINYSASTLQITGYKYDGLKGHSLFQLVPAEIAAVQVRR